MSAMLSRRDAVRVPVRQRVAFTAALLALIVVATLSAGADEPATAAVECGPGDAHRTTLQLAASERAVTPCLSGTTVDITVPTTCRGTICDSKYTVREIRRHGQDTVTYADGSTEKLWHFSFKQLTVKEDLTMGTRGNASGELAIKPQGSAHIGGTALGGQETYTDMWLSSGTFRITVSDLPSLFLCTIPIPEDSKLIDALPGATVRGCGVDLEVKYLVAYDADSSDNDSYPIRLPRTTLEVD